MRTTTIAVLLFAALSISALPMSALADDHVLVQPGSLKWTPAPAGLPAGAQISVLSGNPGADSPFVIRAKLPSGYKVPPHTHPTAENVTVLSGAFHVGMGDKFDMKKGETLRVGGYFRAELDIYHFAWFSALTMIQFNGRV